MSSKARYVECRFSNAISMKGYTYLCFLDDVKVDDYVIVENNGTSAMYGMAIVRVISIADEDTSDYTGAYKQVISRIDMETFTRMKAARDRFVALARRAQRVVARTSVVDRLRLHAGSNPEVNEIVKEMEELNNILDGKITSLS